jgi:hypothetical protein
MKNLISVSSRGTQENNIPKLKVKYTELEKLSKKCMDPKSKKRPDCDEIFKTSRKFKLNKKIISHILSPHNRRLYLQAKLKVIQN